MSGERYTLDYASALTTSGRKPPQQWRWLQLAATATTSQLFWCSEFNSFFAKITPQPVQAVTGSRALHMMESVSLHSGAAPGPGRVVCCGGHQSCMLNNYVNEMKIIVR